MKRLALFAAAGAALTGCASLQPSSPYVGRPIAGAVRELGSPETIADDPSGRRYFSWSTSDVIIADNGADNPAHWLRPMAGSGGTERVDAKGFLTVPHAIVPPFRPRPCTFTLVAEWEAAAKAWIARKAIRGGAGEGGHCGMRGED